MCTLLHQWYAEFSPLLLQEFKKHCQGEIDKWLHVTDEVRWMYIHNLLLIILKWFYWAIRTGLFLLAGALVAIIMNLQGLVRQVSHNVTMLFPIIEQVLLHGSTQEVVTQKTTYESADRAWYKNFMVITLRICCMLFRP